MPTDTVVEIWPSAGWYTEILAPLVRSKGVYYAATQPPGNYRDATVKLLESDSARFGKVRLSVLEPGKPSEIAPPGSADVVLTFRNVHNLLMAGEGAATQAFADFFKASQCGQCPPCRMETATIAAVFQKAASGEAGEYAAQVEKIAAFTKGKGNCSLIEMAAAPALSALRLFPGDFESHAKTGRCPA